MDREMLLRADSQTKAMVFQFEVSKDIIISSPDINEKKVKRIIELIRERQESGVTITVITLKAECYPENRVEKTRQLIKQLLEVGIKVNLVPVMHEHYAVIDREIVWYGSMDLLSSTMFLN